MRIRSSLCLLFALALLVPAVAIAQPTPGAPVTWVSFLQAKPGQSEALTKVIIDQGEAIYGPLMEAGDILLWGVGQPIVHTSDQNYSHAEWVVFKNWAGLDAFMAAFQKKIVETSEEERTAEQHAYMSATVPGSHFDVVVRTVQQGGKPLARPAYLGFGFVTTHTGVDFLELFNKYRTPVMAEVSESGGIGAFGVDRPEIHGDLGWNHMVWYEMPGLAARDALEAAQAKAGAAMAPEEREAMQTAMRESIDWDLHWDEIMMVVHYAAAEMGGGQEGEE